MGRSRLGPGQPAGPGTPRQAPRCHALHTENTRRAGPFSLLSGPPFPDREARLGEWPADPGPGASRPAGDRPPAQRTVTAALASLPAPFEVQRMGLAPPKQAVNQAGERKLSTPAELWRPQRDSPHPLGRPAPPLHAPPVPPAPFLPRPAPPPPWSPPPGPSAFQGLWAEALSPLLPRGGLHPACTPPVMGSPLPHSASLTQTVLSLPQAWGGLTHLCCSGLAPARGHGLPPSCRDRSTESPREALMGSEPLAGVGVGVQGRPTGLQA